MDAKSVRKFHRGVTLLELILALGLSVVVLMAIGMAIDLNYRMLDVRRTNVEEAQLASSVLRHMADDLRCTIQYSPPDTNGITAVAQNAVSAAAVSITNAAGGVTGASGGGQGSGTGGGTGQGSGAGGGSQNTQTTGGQGQGNQNTGNQSGANTSGGAGGQNSGPSGAGAGGPAALNMGAATPIDPNATAADPTSVVGLYGSATQLQFDISRLPRIDQYQALMDGSGLGAVDIPSDVKTVIYFIQAEGATLAGDETAKLDVATVPEPSTTGQGRGLMRSEIDRAVASWAEANGATQSLYADAKLLAAEVTGLEFRYFDGAEWLSDWDSTAMDGLPVAVEILMAIPSSNPASEAETSGDLSADAASLLSGETYRMVVHLPVAVSAQQKLAEADAAQAAVASAQAATVSGNGQFANNTTGAGGAGQLGGGGQGNNGQGGQGQGGNNQGGPGGNNGLGGQGQPGVPGFGNGGQGGQGFPGMPSGNSGNGRGNGGPPSGNFGPRSSGQGQGAGTQGQGFQRPGSYGNNRGSSSGNRSSGNSGNNKSGGGGTSRGR